MSILKAATIGALGFFAYRAWQRHKAESASHAVPDTGDTTPPLGDTIRIHSEDVEPLPSTSVQSSRGFGDT